MPSSEPGLRMLKSGHVQGVWEKEFGQEMEKEKKSLHKSGVQFVYTDIEAAPSELNVPLFSQHFKKEQIMTIFVHYGLYKS